MEQQTRLALPPYRRHTQFAMEVPLFPLVQAETTSCELVTKPNDSLIFQCLDNAVTALYMLNERNAQRTKSLNRKSRINLLQKILVMIEKKNVLEVI